MAIAGRVAIVPKGEWSQDVTYDKLDLVTHNGNTFIAYKSSVGVEPVDGDTWMLVMQGIDPQDIENIINGTTPVGDSNKLGGKGASEYVSDKGGTISDYLNFKSVENGRTAMTKYHSATSDNGFMIQDVNANNEFINFYVSANDGLKVRYKNNTTGQVLSSVNVGEYALPKTGGEVYNGINMIPLGVKGHGQASYIKYLNTVVGLLGYLGFLDKDTPVFETSTGSAYSLLHTGNKPTGTYTGNGDATERKIATNGIGNAVMVFGQNGTMAIVSARGVICADETGVRFFGRTNGAYKLADGNIYMNSADKALNEMGITYQWQEL